MEGPSLTILTEELKPFVGKKVLKVSGNTTIDKEQLKGLHLKTARSWGKQLLLDFGKLTLKVHFLMYGSYRINEEKEGRAPRLQLKFKGGEFNLYSCSVRILTDEELSAYDWELDVMSDEWNPARARRAVKARPKELLCDVLLDQSIFAGVGNIIKNEVLFNLKLHPLTRTGKLTDKKIKDLVTEARDYCFRFRDWKKDYVLKKHWKIYRRRVCPNCEGKVTMKRTGKFERMSFFCPKCQR